MFFGRIKLWLAATGAFALALVAAYFRGRSTADAAAERERLNDYVETRKRIDESYISDDPDILRSWLHERGKQ